MTTFPIFNWIRGVSDDTRISIIHRLVLIRLCTHRQKDGRCNPGYDRLAAELGVHRATVFRAIDVAIKWGWIAKPAGHGGRTLQNFVLTFPVGPSRESDDPDVSTVAPVRPLETSTVASVQRNRRTRATQPSQRQRASRSKSEASSGLWRPSAHFERSRGPRRRTRRGLRLDASPDARCHCRA
jgi:hypothetical protein